MFALGNTQTLSVTEPDLVKEIITCTSLDLGKPTSDTRELGALLGQGILTSNGPHWAHQRKIIGPELYMDKVKVSKLVDTWENMIEDQGGIADIKVDEHLRCFAGDVISRACFGSNFSRNGEIFSTLRALQDVTSKAVLSANIPGMGLLPTKTNRERWALEKELRTLILNVVKERNEFGYENDLLQTLIEGAKNGNLSQDLSERFIVHNCKNIYVAASATGFIAAWCLMLLATNQEWQDRLRAEALQVCKGQMPNVDMILKMKQAFKDIKFGGITVPKGVNIWTLVTRLHTDPELWGPDAYKFNPERFANGVTGACKQPHLYMPFGFGPRVCPGQNLALAELKVVIAVIVTKFSLSLSPKYMHKPSLNLVIEPGNGVDLLVKKL
ncbi:hypothetical protein RJ640_006068 [Escallonia rubra]|uniref:Cytochrome P450 n=1 Tax=Escallonia rubra TaxID=112253 RepID=A0AA88UHB3_9ASTE|nr:hypothetical protein RJ640_006068 [Escallonia rubra]